MTEGSHTTPSDPKSRLLSLDAFRGLDIVLMFLVNVAGADKAFPEWFEHRGYNDGKHGNGLADFVFPWFLFIVGCAIPFSMSSGRGAGRTSMQKVFTALRRGATIYLLGTLVWCAYCAFKPDSPGRFHQPINYKIFLHWDILPLIGFGYATAAILWLLPRKVSLAFVAASLLFKWLSLTQLAHPDLGKVVWTDSQSMDQWIKRSWGWFGVLLTQGLPAASLVVLGSFAGEMLRRGTWGLSRPENDEPVPPLIRGATLFTFGFVVSILSYGLHRWNMPYSKDFLTSSYVLLMAGTGSMVLAMLQWLVDVRQATTLLWLRIYGANAIFIYLLAELMWKMIFVRWYAVVPDGPSTWLITAWKAWMQWPLGATLGSWAHVASYILVYWLVAAWLYRRKIFIKV